MSAAEPNPAPHAAAPAPYLRLRDTTLGYHGPSEDFTNLSEIRIGWFGPSDPDDPLHGDSWWAANLAIEEANQHPSITDHSAAVPSTISTTFSPAFAALPIRLLPKWAPDPWRAGVSLLARMVYDEQPLALLGSVDSASTHLAEQVVAKAQLPLVSPIATDKTSTLAGVAWMFSCAPDDTAIARALVDEILRTTGSNEEPGKDGAQSRPQTLQSDGSCITVGAPLAGARGRRPATPLQQTDKPSREAEPDFVLLTTTDHESRMTARELVREFSRRGRLPEFRFDLPPGATLPANVVAALTQARPAAVIIIAGPEDCAGFIRALRSSLPTAVVLGGPAMARQRFLELAGSAAEGVRFPLLFAPGPHDEIAARFVARFTTGRHHAPDYTAALAYDATRLLIEAIRRAGPNRARIRDALVQLSPWAGIAGPMDFDGTGQNRRAQLQLGTIRDGAFVALHALPDCVEAQRAAPSSQVAQGAASGAPTAQISAPPPANRWGRDAPVAFIGDEGVAAPLRRAYLDPEVVLSPSP